MQEIFEKLYDTKIGIVGMGYVGKNLYEYLLKQSYIYNYKVESITRSNLATIKGREFDYIFNCAGNSGDFRHKIWETIESNLFLTHFLMAEIKINRAYVGLSSTRLYGFSDNKEAVFSEEDVSGNLNSHLSIDFVYDGTKKLLESVLLNVSDNKPYKTVICRMSNIYGSYIKADLDDSTYLKVMLKHTLSKDVLLVKQNIYNSKGYIFIEDAMEGIVRSGVFATESTVYNICSGLSYSVKDWLAYLNVNYEYSGADTRESHSKICIKKAQAELLFKPKYFLNNLEFNKILKNGSN